MEKFSGEKSATRSGGCWVFGGMPQLRLGHITLIKIWRSVADARIDSDRGGHPGLVSTIIAATLENLNSEEVDGRLVSTTRSGSLKYSWSDMYHTLAVLPASSASMPINYLAF